ncbi:MAG TPA: hypothetical protein VJZ26_10430, partial [Blastocatellia bacterium]|nr:hypothetical protein [Blastocatellia bacterium]
MKIPLPNLDDRRWADLVEEGRSLIPLYAPDWTDHNIHDPGITLIELFAWIAEMDIYELNRITDEHKRKFLSLIGITPDPPRPSRTVLSFKLKEGFGPRRLRASAEVAGNDPFGEEARFRTLDSITVAPGRLRSIQIKDVRGFQNYTDRFERVEQFGAFGDGAEAGAELYLGFTHALRRGRPLSLYFKFAGWQSGDDERARLIEEFKLQQTCQPPASGIDCKPKASSHATAWQSGQVPPFHGARIVWEFLAEVDGKQKWLALDPNKQKVVDDTRALTLDGRVIIRVTAPMLKATVGKVEGELYWLRCRFEAGAYDAAPMIETIVMNGVRAEQSIPIPTKLTIKSNAVVEGNHPPPCGLTGFSLELDELNRVTRIKFEDPEDGPRFRVLNYKPPVANTEGSLTVEAIFVGKGNGQPLQQFKLPVAPVEQESLALFTFEDGKWYEWTREDDFEAATRNSFNFLLGPTEGQISFGDGNRGRAVPSGGLIFAVYRSTRAESGNLAARAINLLVDSPHNRALLNYFDVIKERLEEITNPVAAEAGRAAETLDHAEGRAIELMNSTTRAVTLKDYEELAMKTPGVRLARVA